MKVLLQSKTRWKKQNIDQQELVDLAKSLKVSHLVASLLVGRGFKQVDDAKRFLHCQYDFYDPFLLKGMDIAVDRINLAITNGEKIRVYGDYDADGVTSTTVLYTALLRKGAVVDYYIPNRFNEGYGPNEYAFNKAKEEGISLIITVDTGISAIHEANVAKELGIDYIITDHHEPGPELPDCLAIIHPKLEENTYPFHELAGVGVAFKVACALIGEEALDLLPFVAIGTVADLVPLADENRLLVKEGLQRLRTFSNKGLQELFRIAGVKQEQSTEDTIGFALAPRINAVGRLGDAYPAVELLLTESEEQAKELAQLIDSCNKERQEIVAGITEEAVAIVEELAENGLPDVLIVANTGWNPGVVGIVASKLVEKYYRPTIVLCIDEEKGIAKGSARSIEAYDMFENLSLCRDILPHFGGHPMAAGMTLEIEDVEQLRERLNEQAALKLKPSDFIPVTTVDSEFSVSDISLEAVTQLGLLSPFGVGNPKPKFLITEGIVSNVKRIGSDSSHLKLIIEDDKTSLECIAFGKGEKYSDISPNAQIQVVGELQINEWNSVKKPQLLLSDMAIVHRQLVDLRTRLSFQQFSSYEIGKDIVVFTFDPETIIPKQFSKNEVVTFQQIEQDSNSLKNKKVIFLDIPPSYDALMKTLEKGVPNISYIVFQDDDSLLFYDTPSREQLGWLYAVLKKYPKVTQQGLYKFVEKQKGWSSSLTAVLIKIFEELDFIDVTDGIVMYKEIHTKKELTDSRTYYKLGNKQEVEEKLKLSSYKELSLLFNDFVKSDEH